MNACPHCYRETTHVKPVTAPAYYLCDEHGRVDPVWVPDFPCGIVFVYLLLALACLITLGLAFLLAMGVI